MTNKNHNLLGWECIGCLAGFKYGPLHGSVTEMVKCPECHGTVFRRIEGIPGVHVDPLYPEREPDPGLRKSEEPDPEEWRAFENGKSDLGSQEVDQAQQGHSRVSISPGSWLIKVRLESIGDHSARRDFLVPWCIYSDLTVFGIPRETGHFGESGSFSGNDMVALYDPFFDRVKCFFQDSFPVVTQFYKPTTICADFTGVPVGFKASIKAERIG